MIRVLIAPDKFRGSMTATEAAEAIEKGFKKAFKDASFLLVPLADGGEGFVEAMVNATNGHKVTVKNVRDPLMRKCTAFYGWLGDGKTAVVEMAQTSGLWRLKKTERNPLLTSTYGVGELIRHAMEKGAQRILIGVGGSATNDGGIGMATALGFRFLDAKGNPLEPVGKNLGKIEKIEKPQNLSFPEIIVGCDVQTKLLGKKGASAIFGPQKGATPSMVQKLDEGLENLAKIQNSGVEKLEGSGAAGGLSYGLMSFCGAKLENGFELVAKHADLQKKVQEANIIITGEGALDAQTAEGKGPEGLRRLAKKAGKPVIAIAGRVEERGEFDAVFSICEKPISIEEAIRYGEKRLENASENVARLLKVGKFI